MSETRVELIRMALQALQPEQVQIFDDSHLHAGHAGSPGTGESHYRVIVVSGAFEGIGRVERQRMVYAALHEEFASGMHALTVSALTPDQDSASAD